MIENHRMWEYLLSTQHKNINKPLTILDIGINCKDGPQWNNCLARRNKAIMSQTQPNTSNIEIKIEVLLGLSSQKLYSQEEIHSVIDRH